MSLLFSTGAFASSLSGAAPGMVLINPTSIAYSGTSASVGANGQVTFTAVTSLSLNGVFSADFDNYVVAMQHIGSSGDGLDLRLRLSGSDATASNYTYQEIQASSTTISASRTTTSAARQGAIQSTSRNGHQILLYGPYLAQPTATRCISVDAASSARIYETAATHSLSTSYDGFTLKSNGGTVTFTGTLTVMGVRS